MANTACHCEGVAQRSAQTELSLYKEKEAKSIMHFLAQLQIQGQILQVYSYLPKHNKAVEKCINPVTW